MPLRIYPDHLNLYCEPFVGGGAVFFAKGPSSAEVINDLNGNVVNFYQVCKQEFSKLNTLIQATPHSRKLHKEAAAILKNENEKDKIKKAWAFWVQTNMSFSARIFGGYAYEKKTNGVSKTIFNKKQAFTNEICDRLDLVDIECNDALTVIKSRDTKDTFFYVDPPYFNSDMGHYKGYTEKDFIELLELLSKIKGKFLLSSYPSTVLDTYKKKYKWDQHVVEKKVAVTKQTNKKKTEVLTANYNIQKKISNLLGFPELQRMIIRSRALKLRL
ncbi:DNA adenine methylase [Aquimarina celericrescens]|uniref:DNA adenine methylase n=1 Tax=Aquimarina celericrescens TaxID=1964542 RepID=A0ABW5AX10_9FLAO|nr:DNA adenine methylase [Aquimarina celericrescens]